MMKQQSLGHAKYWRNSLADAELGKGRFEKKDVEAFCQRPGDELLKGIVNRDVVNQLFEGESADAQSVEVMIRQKVFLYRVEHGNNRQFGVPKIVTPVVSTALLARNGRLYPSSTTVMPRDILEPLEQGAFAIGSVSDLDTFLTKNTVPAFGPPTDDKEIDESLFSIRWSRYLEHCEQLFSDVGTGWTVHDTNFEPANYWYLIKNSGATGASKHILNLYDHIRDNNPATLLFDKYAENSTSPPEPCLPANACFSTRLGHASDTFPLAEAQRDALAHQLVANEGEILAVNGPPGTGKTTMLLSVVASLWAKAALAESEPPVILAASTNNQAVTNIIDAFGKDFSTGSGPLASRWVPYIESFGAYFPSRSREAKLAGKYQTRSFFEKIESEDFVVKAEYQFLKSAEIAFPDIENITVKTAIAELHQAIKVESKKLNMIESSWKHLALARDAVKQELGDDPTIEIANRRQERELLQAEKKSYDSFAEQWETYLAEESLFYAIFSWLPPVAKKRMRLAKQFLKQSWPSETPYTEYDSLDQIETTLNKIVSLLKFNLIQQEKLIERGEELLQEQTKQLEIWRNSLRPLNLTGNTEELSLGDCDAISDTRIRFKIFLLTTHYWEGRWLLEMKKLLPTIEKEKARTGRIALEARWRRRMKLTPCIVSTFHMLPSEMKASRHDGTDFVPNYLYDFADLLIVDEAGQVLPEVAGASFSLAKKALIIGDTQQIEPIWSVPSAVDIGNLADAEIIPTDGDYSAYERFSETGKSAASGSVMRIAQGVSRYHYDPDLVRGMFLYEHRRCYDEIISYCNELCYNNKLIPKRGLQADKHALPSVGYLHIDGACQKIGSSRQNLLEADTIAAWISQHKDKLEAKYSDSIDKIVGVVTPFSGQVAAISSACHKNGIKVGSLEGEMTVGTTHSLQGAERPVVIFSSVYSKHADGGFIDRNASMLNVAVSRAKDNFLVFGDMDVFEIIPKTKPRGLLASYLFRVEDNGLQFENQPRKDLSARKAGISQLQNAQQHDAFMLDTLSNAAREVHIITPWIRLQRINETGAMEAMSAAVQRGVNVHVYTDPGLNTSANDSLIAATRRQELQLVAEELRGKDIEVIFVRKVHSKIVIGDDDLLCIGSFNWFSANRAGPYARHETSLVYRGSSLTKEIGITRDSLKRRAINQRVRGKPVLS